jgi:hypothetical protein
MPNSGRKISIYKQKFNSSPVCKAPQLLGPTSENDLQPLLFPLSITIKVLIKSGPSQGMILAFKIPQINMIQKSDKYESK